MRSNSNIYLLTSRSVSHHNIPITSPMLLESIDELVRSTTIENRPPAVGAVFNRGLSPIVRFSYSSQCLFRDIF